MNKQILLQNNIPKYLGKSCSKCRRKLYWIIGKVEYSLLNKHILYIPKLCVHKRIKIKSAVYNFYALQLGWSVRALKFKNMSNS